MIDTQLIHRLREQLLAKGLTAAGAPAGAALEELAPYEAAALERVAPLAELLFLMMGADGAADVRERDAIRGAVRTLTDGILPAAAADRLVDRFGASLAEAGRDERLGAVIAVLAGDRDDAEVGALLAAAVALADGRVCSDENALFERVTSDLGISRRRLDELLGR